MPATIANPSRDRNDMAAKTRNFSRLESKTSPRLARGDQTHAVFREEFARSAREYSRPRPINRWPRGVRQGAPQAGAGLSRGERSGEVFRPQGRSARPNSADRRAPPATLDEARASSGGSVASTSAGSGGVSSSTTGT